MREVDCWYSAAQRDRQLLLQKRADADGKFSVPYVVLVHQDMEFSLAAPPI